MSNLFGTSGIRGIANEDIIPRFVIRISKAIATEIDKTGKAIIGRDSRVSGKMLEDAAVSGFLASGLEVEKIGIVPTPVVAYTVSNSNADLGVMITASHNPPQYNGLKFFNSDGKPFSSKKEKEVEETYRNSNFRKTDWSEIKNTTNICPIETYLKEIIEKIDIRKKHQTVIDCACGPSSKTTPYLLEKLGCKVKTLNSHLDGTFPGREAEPKDAHLTDLKEMIKNTEADIGFAHDGDGDRVAVIDNKGRFVDMDKLLGLLGSYYTKKFGKGIVTTVDASKIVDDLVKEEGGKVLRTKVGDVNVSQKMVAEGINFGGEPSGSFIIGDIHLCADGTLAAAKILEMVDNFDKPLSEIVDKMPSYPIIRTNISCPNSEKEKIMDLFKSEAEEIFRKTEEILTVDGVRLKPDKNGWLLVRPSGTEPYIRITAESDEKKKAQNYVEKAEEFLEKRIDSL